MTRVSTFIVLAIISASSSAQEVFYIIDKLYIPLRSGPGAEYRILHRGIPTGTEMVVNERTEDGKYSRITTANGSEGWLRSQYLTTEVPARTKVATLQEQKQALEQQMES
ncbi:MAG: TIGR04211 family SH3 domain-containing protein, partial [Lysobacterales bacterium]